MGSGVLLKSDDKTIVITAWHVLGNADEIDQKCLTIEQYQNNVLTELTLTVNEYELLKEVDIAVIHITTDCVVYEMNLCTPHYSGSVIVSGYPEVLSNNEKNKWHYLTGSITQHLFTYVQVSINERLGSISKSEKEHVNGFSGGGIFIESNDQIYLCGIETGTLTGDVAFNVICGIPITYIISLLEYKKPELGKSLEELVNNDKDSDQSNVLNEIEIEEQSEFSIEEQNKYSIEEHFLLGDGIESMHTRDPKAINEAFRNARDYYSTNCIWKYSENADLDYEYLETYNNQQMYINMHKKKVSLRFADSQELRLEALERVVQNSDLSIVDAVRYGCSWENCVDRRYWAYDYLRELENDTVEKARKYQNQLQNKRIPDDEICSYSLITLFRNGYTLEELCLKQYDINDLVRFGFDERTLTKYYPQNVIDNAIQSAERLFSIIESPGLAKYEKYGPIYLANSGKFEVKEVLKAYQIEDIYHAYNLEEILKEYPVVPAKTLKKGRYHADELASQGYTLRQLAAAGFDTRGITVIKKNNQELDENQIINLIKDIIFDMEEYPQKEEWLCGRKEAELLKKLKEKGLTLEQIWQQLPFYVDSSPCYVRWLLMAGYTVEELETENIEWKRYFEFLPPSDLFENEEYENYQSAGVLPLELFKSGLLLEVLRTVYDQDDYLLELEKEKGLRINNLREEGFNAMALFNMGRPLDELLEVYSPNKDEDVCEMALSGYDLRSLQKAGFSPRKLREQYERVLINCRFEDYKISDSSRYRTIEEYINKHGNWFL